MLPIIDLNKDAIIQLARDFGVSRLEIFGSSCTPQFDPIRSDIDFLVDYPADYDYGPWFGRFQELQQSLEDLLGKKVDLFTTTSLRNKWFRREANKTRTVIYDASQIAEVA
jgi:predicted nucleotidyltransferase